MSRTQLRSLAPLLVLYAACSDAGTTTAPIPDTEISASQSAIGVQSVKPQEIQELVDALEAAWAAKDAAAYAAPYAEDLMFIGPVANILAGREAFRAQHAFLFGPAGPFRVSTQTLEISRIEFLTGTTAIVDQVSVLTGFLFLPPGLRESEPGVVRALVRWVVVKRDGAWEIAAQQMTPVPPAS